MSAKLREVGVRELRGNLSEYLRKAKAGERFVVVSRGQPIVEFHGVQPPDDLYGRPGALEGQIWMADDFDTLPDDILDAIEADLPQ